MLANITHLTMAAASRLSAFQVICSWCAVKISCLLT